MLLLALVAGCTPGPELEVEVEVCPVPTSLILRWSTDEPGSAWVELPDGAATPPGPSTTLHEVLVTGLVAGSALDLLPVTELEDSTRVEAELVEVDVSPPPQELVTLEVQGAEAVSGLVLTTQYGPDASFVVVHDRQGQVVWWHTLPPSTNTLGAELALAGGGLSFLYFDRLQAEDVGTVVQVDWCGSDEVLTPALLGHHDHVELADGSVAWLGLETREAEVEGETLLVTGDTILETPAGDGAQPDTVFDFFDDYAEPWPASPEFQVEAYQTGGRDWTRSNSLTFREADQTFFLMSRNLDALLAIERDTGEVRWQLGGELGDFEIIGQPFDHGHFSYYEGDRLLVFDNGDHREPQASRVVEYQVDEDQRTATEVWSVESEDYVKILGDATRLDDGHTLISWSTLGKLTEVDEQGEVVWEASAPLGRALGRVVALEGLDP